MQDTPASATVLTADAIASQGIDNVSEIQQVAPSVAINTYNRSTFINIRGVGIAQSRAKKRRQLLFLLVGRRRIAVRFEDRQTERAAVAVRPQTLPLDRGVQRGAMLEESLRQRRTTPSEERMSKIERHDLKGSDDASSSSQNRR